jgi:hypothetical protein
VSLPTADDLFRPTDPQAAELQPADAKVVRAVPDPSVAETAEDEPRRRPSGRVRHDEKMTVYITSAELLHLERARLELRADHGLAVDRGRLVREALAIVLAELEELGDDSALVRRLTEE